MWAELSLIGGLILLAVVCGIALWSHWPRVSDDDEVHPL